MFNAFLLVNKYLFELFTSKIIIFKNVVAPYMFSSVSLGSFALFQFTSGRI